MKKMMGLCLILLVFSATAKVLDKSDLEDISGEASLGDSCQPYFGIGRGRKAGREPGLVVSFEIEVALLDPNVDLEATVNPPGSNFPTQEDLDASLRDAARDAEDELDEYEFFPLVSLGINYAF